MEKQDKEMSASELAKQMGFSSLTEAARALGLTDQALFKRFRTDRQKFNDALISAKLNLTLEQIDFYRECAGKSNITFKEWLKQKDEI